MRIRITFNGQTMIATLEDNPSARDFASMSLLTRGEFPLQIDRIR